MSHYVVKDGPRHFTIRTGLNGIVVETAANASSARAICRRLNAPSIKTNKWQFEKTDTFGGEANYSWVNREEIEIADGASDREIVRQAKAWAGWTGYPCRTSSYSDSFEIRPSGMCEVLFVNFLE